MTARVIDLARYRAEREQTAIRAAYEGEPRWRQKRRPLSDIMDAGPWAGRWS